MIHRQLPDVSRITLTISHLVLPSVRSAKIETIPVRIGQLCRFDPGVSFRCTQTAHSFFAASRQKQGC